jgi:hypothetical protein
MENQDTAMPFPYTEIIHRPIELSNHRSRFALRAIGFEKITRSLC